MDLTIKDIVKDNMTFFSYLRGENAYYSVTVKGNEYIYPVSLSDLGGASIFAEMKAITLMRYIRKAMEDKTFVFVGANDNASFIKKLTSDLIANLQRNVAADKAKLKEFNKKEAK